MLVAVKNIGEILEKSNQRIEDATEGKILILNINTSSNDFKITIEDYNPNKINSYLFKKRSSKGNTSVPFVPIGENQKSFNNIQKSFDKIRRWISKAVKEIEKDTSKIEKALQILTKKKTKILKELWDKLSEYSKKEIKFITFKINGKYPGDIVVLQEFYKQNAEQKVLKTSTKNKTCSICGEIKDEVSARTFVYQFDTDDKPGFISEFNKKNFWKNIPVCKECRKYLETSRKFIDTNLKFQFAARLSYQIIPDVLVKDLSLLEKVLHILKDTKKNVSLSDRVVRRITEDENDILYLLKDFDNRISFNLLFMESSNSAERILLNVEEVLPSRLKEIFDAKEIVDSLFNNEREYEKFTFGKIRNFFSTTDTEKKDYDLDRYFLEIVDAVFKDKKLSFPFLTKFFMNIISKKFMAISDNDETSDWKFRNAVKDAMMCVSFFENLKLINFKEEAMEGSIFDAIFNKYGKSLNTPEKRGIFLLGALTQMLLQVQYNTRGSKPFLKKLKNLKMDEADIKSLLPEIHNKFEEYDAFDKGKKLIAQEISNYLLSAGDNWKMSVDEINYYFACGMSLANDVKNIVYNKDEGKGDE